MIESHVLFYILKWSSKSSGSTPTPFGRDMHKGNLSIIQSLFIAARFTKNMILHVLWMILFKIPLPLLSSISQEEGLQRERKRNNRLKSSCPPSVQFSLSLSLFFGGDKDLVELHERKHQENFLWQSFNETYVNCLIQLNTVSCNDQLSNWKLKCRYFKLTADLWI